MHSALFFICRLSQDERLYVIVFYIIRNRGIMEQKTYIFTFKMARMYNHLVS